MHAVFSVVWVVCGVGMLMCVCVCVCVHADCEPRMEQLNKFYSHGNRMGGKRETAAERPELERAWRNSRSLSLISHV